MGAEDRQEQTTALERVSQGVAVLILLLLAAGIVFAVVGIYPHQVPTTKNPSFIDNIFASRVVILATRIALMFAAAYVAVSVVGLIASRRWLSQIGPFKASDPIAQLDRSTETLEEGLQDAVETIGDLECRLIDSDDALAKGQDDIELLLEHIDTIEREQKED